MHAAFVENGKSVEMSLSDFLEAKPLYYDAIDYDRMPRTYAAIREHIRVPNIIHVVGTNGKGTTGRFMANALHRSGYHVGHYTSPHIIAFNERIWLDGANADNALLETSHRELFALLGRERADALSYFEYTTLLAMMVYRRCDWVVLEAGMGGEHDATNVFAKRLSVFTPIDLDHQAFLGENITAIATTKLRSMGPEAVIGIQPHGAVYEVYDKIAMERGARNHRVQEVLSDGDFAVAGQVAKTHSFPVYMEENLRLAMAALKVLGMDCTVEMVEGIPLFGRLSRVRENVTVDVGHNLLAAEAVCRALYPQQVVLVYNSYRDKAFNVILQTLKPIVKRVEIIAVDEERIVDRSILEAVLKEAGIPYRSFEGVRKNERYLVFGSFSVVEAYMRHYNA